MSGIARAKPTGFALDFTDQRKLRLQDRLHVLRQKPELGLGERREIPSSGFQAAL